MPNEDDLTTPTKSVGIMGKLKKATQKYHSRLESLPFFQTLAEHKLPLQGYMGQLKALATVYSALEDGLSASADPIVSAVWEEDLRKLPLLQADIAFFEVRLGSGQVYSQEAGQAVQSMASKIRIRGVEKPTTMLGYLYVFEGSTLGNEMHQPDVVATFRLRGLNGYRYYSSYQHGVRSHWKVFSGRMDAALADPSLHEPIIEAAQEAFDCLEEIYRALSTPETKNGQIHATAINPEAGRHPMPQDPREVAAALRASDRAWQEFPYYQARYSERGKRFSDSDMCWLVTLSALNPGDIEGQINWLCGVLATRGMPSLMMETSLRMLHQELANAIPANSETYDKLFQVAESLKEKRVKRLGEEELRDLEQEFDETADSAEKAIYPHIGTLLASAVVDEKNGFQGTVEALRAWLTDSDRFSEPWISAVNRTIEKAFSIVEKT